MPDIRQNGDTSNTVRFRLTNSSTGQGLTGLSSSSAGLIISTIADVEASATTYTQGGSTIESISTLGTFAAPTTNKCRFKEVDATNHPGLYEFQFANARFAVSNAKRLVISVTGAASLQDTSYEIEFTPPVDAEQINANAEAAVRLGRSARSITKGTVGSSSTTTSIVTSACDPAGAAVDQFKGLILQFDKDTTTAALRGQKTDITASTNASTPVLTVSALTTAPVSGDTFTIN